MPVDPKIRRLGLGPWPTSSELDSLRRFGSPMLDAITSHVRSVTDAFARGVDYVSLTNGPHEIGRIYRDGRHWAPPEGVPSPPPRTRRHIGGSILPPSDPGILRPIETGFGRLQVRAIPDLDTHGLFLAHERGESMLAMHPNGYSCHHLAKAMAAGDVGKARAQVHYLLRCGGLAQSLDSILSWMSPSAEEREPLGEVRGDQRCAMLFANPPAICPRCGASRTHGCGDLLAQLGGASNGE